MHFFRNSKPSTNHKPTSHRFLTPAHSRHSGSRPNGPLRPRPVQPPAQSVVGTLAVSLPPSGWPGNVSTTPARLSNSTPPPALNAAGEVLSVCAPPVANATPAVQWP